MLRFAVQLQNHYAVLESVLSCAVLKRVDINNSETVLRFAEQLHDYSAVLS